MSRVAEVDFRDIDINEALTIIESKEFRSGQSLGEAVKEWRSRDVTRIKTPWSKLDGRFEFACGGFHLVGGYSGHGKSTSCLQIALNACRDHKVAIASLELPAGMMGETIAKMGVAVGNPSPEFEQRLWSYLEGRLFYFDKLDAIGPDEAVRMVIHAAQNLGCKMVLLDCLFMIRGICQDPEKEQQFTQTLAAVAKRFDVAIVLVHHVRKPSGNDGEKYPPSKAAFIGSSHMVNAAWTCSMFWRNFEVIDQRNEGLPVEQAEPDVVFSVEKNRDMEFHGRVNLYEHPSRLLCATSQRQVRGLV